jgi:hypothetical protein
MAEKGIQAYVGEWSGEGLVTVGMSLVFNTHSWFLFNRQIPW